MLGLLMPEGVRRSFMCLPKSLLIRKIRTGLRGHRKLIASGNILLQASLRNTGARRALTLEIRSSAVGSAQLESSS